MSNDEIEEHEAPQPKYLVDDKMAARIENDFTYHKPFGDQAERYEEIRNGFCSMAFFLAQSCPPSRELSCALTQLEQACFYANAAIARNEKE